jgi:CheY-like chemotaxis protein
LGDISRQAFCVVGNFRSAKEPITGPGESPNGLLDGEITIATDLGQDSTFSFEIPRRGADPVSAKLRPLQVISYEGPRRRILVVDDEPLNRSMLSGLLSTVGFDATEADSAEEALGLLKNHFDAVSRQAERQRHAGTVSDFRKNRVKVRKLRQEIGRRVPLAYSSSKTPISVVASLSKTCKKRTMPGN